MGNGCCANMNQLNEQEQTETFKEKQQNSIKPPLVLPLNEKAQPPSPKNQQETIQTFVKLKSEITKKQEPSSQSNFNQESNRISSEQTINFSKKLKVGPEIFVQLKKGSLSQYYKVGEVLGEGAYGKVFKAVQLQTGIERAMKCLKKSSLINEDQQKLFSELNILKNLDHPNIVKLFELYQDDKFYYLITEYLNGGELFNRIKAMSEFSETTAAKFIKQVLSAVIYCHSQNIVHRDLKPENILFENNSLDSNLKVIDFGTCRRFDRTKKMNKKLGTPYYIAPEVLKMNYDEKCDVWSCGVILYILLCGYPPFGGRNEDEIIAKVKKGKFTFDKDDWENVSSEAKDLIKLMLEYNPKTRISAEDALAHPWIQRNNIVQAIDNKCLMNLQKFHARSKLKQTLLTFIATQLVSNEEQEELRKNFQAIDKNGDGILTREELIEGYRQIYGEDMAMQVVDKIINMIDMNENGLVNFTEFMVASMNEEKNLTKQRIEQTFKAIDLDGNNYLTKDEIEYIMGDIDSDLWQDFLQDCDDDNDGKISLDEFIGLLMQKL